MDDEPLDLPSFLPYRLAVASERVSKGLARIYADRFGLSIYEWRVMANLAMEPGLSANEVAARATLDKVQVSRATARLIDKRLVNRMTDATDRRRSALHLSAEGEKVYQQIVPLARAYEAGVLAGLTDKEQAALGRSLDRLAETPD